MKSETMSDETKIETRVLMPAALSLVVTKRPLPPLDRLVPIEECIKICSSDGIIPVGTVYQPCTGTLRTDKLPETPLLQMLDTRSYFGAFDKRETSGRRTCNWVRFLKVTPFPTSEVNVIGKRFGPGPNACVFEVVQDIPFGGELIAFLIPSVVGSPEGGLFGRDAYPYLTSHLIKSFESYVNDKPLDLSISLLKTSEGDERKTSSSPKSPRRTPSSEVDEAINSDVSSPPSPRSDGSISSRSDRSSSPRSEGSISSRSEGSISSRSEGSISSRLEGSISSRLEGSMSSLHSPLGYPVSPTGFLNQSALALRNAADVFLGHSSFRFSSITGIPGILPQIPHSIPTPPLSSSGSPKDSMRESPPVQAPKRRERTMLPCSECGKAFDRPSLLKRHMRTHTGEKPHVCDVCGKGFSTSSSLNTHRRIHSGEKPHQCATCGKRFTASSNLYYHKMTHIKEKPHKCTQCPRSFPTPGDLRSHMFMHNGLWPHKCGVCGKGFSKLTNLRNHTLLHTTKPRNNTPTPRPSPISTPASPIIMEAVA